MRDLANPTRSRSMRICLDVLLGLILAASFFSLIVIGILTWDRQHTITFLESSTVFDGWDYYGQIKPQPVGTVPKGTTLRVLWKHSGIDSGGIRVRLPDGRLAYQAMWLSEGDVAIKRSFEPFSIVIAFSLGGVFVWLVRSKMKRPIVLLSSAFLFLTCLASLLVLLQGFI